MRRREIRTMRNVWDELAGRKGRALHRGAAQRAERLGLASGIVRIQAARGPQPTDSPHPDAIPATPRRAVHPWIFRRVARGLDRRVRGRVKAVVAPKAEIRRSPRGKEFLVLYPLPHVEEESIAVELKGDVLRLNAQGTDPHKGATFEVLSETLLPQVLSGSRVECTYDGQVLEVVIAPARAPSARRSAPQDRAGRPGASGPRQGQGGARSA